MVPELTGLANELRIGLTAPALNLEGLAVPSDGDDVKLELRVADNCLAVMPTYLLARLPAVILLIAAEDASSKRGGGGGLEFEGRFAPSVPLFADGVTKLDGVTRPFVREGVTRPLKILGVMRPEKDGVIRPDIEARFDATDEGREKAPGPTVGGDSFVTATKTPHLGGQSKYRLLFADV